MTRSTRTAPRFEAKTTSPDSAEIHIYDVIGDSWYGITAKQVIEALESFKGMKRLDVFVNSPGGSAFDGVAIFNALRRFEGEKVVRIDGLAASAASVIALAGDRIVIGPGAMVMIHNPAAVEYGDSSDHRKTADVLDSLRDSIVELYVNRTGQSQDDLRRWMDDETWMSGATAVARGFATEFVLPALPTDPADEPQNMASLGGMPPGFESVLATFQHAPGHAAGLLNRSRLESKSKETPKMKILLVKMGLTETATEANAIAAYEKLEARVADGEKSNVLVTGLATAVGESDLGKLEAVVSALKVKADRTDELQAQLLKIEDERRVAEIVSMLDEASEDGRLTPANREKLVAADAPAYARDPEQLKAFLGMLTKAAPQPKAPTVEAAKDRSWSEMSNTEKAELFLVDRDLAEKLRAESAQK